MSLSRVNYKFKYYLRASRELLKHRSFKKFRHDGVDIQMSRSGHVFEIAKDLISARIHLSGKYELCIRATEEPLLRAVVCNLIQKDVLPKGSTIIDIGCWLGDNAIPWAINGVGKDISVMAVDPSIRNIMFAKEMAVLNGLSNIDFHNAVCGENGSTRLINMGSPDHGTFHPCNNEDNEVGILSTTLDELWHNDGCRHVGLLHIDVEGMEPQVLKGAEKIVSSCEPLIVFEDHINDGNLINLKNILNAKNYKVYMINEVLTCARPDTRNYLAVPSKHQDQIEETIMKLPEISDETNYYKAVVGPLLVSI